MTGLSILAGLLTAEVTHKVARHLDDKDEDVKRLLSGENVTEEDLEQAVLLLSEDKTKMEQIHDGLKQHLVTEGNDPNQVEKGLQPLRSRMT